MSRMKSGERFGFLVTVRRVADANGKPMWECLCDCGKAKVVRGSHLTAGNVRSCGCQTSRLIGDAKRDHGKTGTRIYRIWRDMINRCHYSGYPERRYYGGRGISVCAEWRSSFKAFYADMGDPPSSIHSIDRINNDGNYEKGNCRWATPKEQAANRRPENART